MNNPTRRQFREVNQNGRGKEGRKVESNFVRARACMRSSRAIKARVDCQPRQIARLGERGRLAPQTPTPPSDRACISAGRGRRGGGGDQVKSIEFAVDESGRLSHLASADRGRGEENNRRRDGR